MHMIAGCLHIEHTSLLDYITSINNNVYPGCTRRPRKGQDLRGHILLPKLTYVLPLMKLGVMNGEVDITSS